MIFSEDRLCDGYIIYGTDGGPEFSTDIVVLNSGFEQANKNWPYARGKWDFGDRKLPESELHDIIKFFRARGGRAQGFRFKDWSDYQASVAEGILGLTGGGAGVPAYQMVKKYAHGVDTDYRIIPKPVAGTTAFYKNGTVLTVGSAPGNIALDTTTGFVTFVPTATVSITGISQASIGVVTTGAAHGLTTGALVYLTGIAGMIALNNLPVVATVVDATHFSIGVNTVSMPAYVSGGTAASYPQTGDALTWAGEFDVPSRFDVDKLNARFEGADVVRPGVLGTKYFYLTHLPIVEIRT